MLHTSSFPPGVFVFSRSIGMRRNIDLLMRGVCISCRRCAQNRVRRVVTRICAKAMKLDDGCNFGGCLER